MGKLIDYIAQQTIDLAEFEYRNSAKLKQISSIWLSLGSLISGF